VESVNVFEELAVLDVFDASAAPVATAGVMLDVATGAASPASAGEAAELACGSASGTARAPAGLA